MTLSAEQLNALLVATGIPLRYRKGVELILEAVDDAVYAEARDAVERVGKPTIHEEVDEEIEYLLSLEQCGSYEEAEQLEAELIRRNALRFGELSHHRGGG